MYRDFYGFSDRPFALLIDPHCFYPSGTHKDILDTLKQSIATRDFLCVMTGEIGTGKSTLIRYLLDNLDDDITAGLLSTSNISSDDFISRLLAAFNQPSSGSGEQLTKALSQFVIAEKSRNRHPVLIIDDSHNLPVDVLNILYVLIKEFADNGQGLTTILVGEPDLLETLHHSDLEHISRRINTNCMLQPLTRDETNSYIHYRCELAGGKPGIFEDSACKEIYLHTEGAPRSINLLCDSALVYGYVDENKIISASIVSHVANDRKEGKLLPALVKAEEIARERVQQVKEATRIKDEEETRVKEEEELQKRKQAEEKARIEAEKKAARLNLEEEEISFKAEQEQTRLKKQQEEKEARRLKEESKENEAQRLNEEKAARVKADLDAAREKAKLNLAMRSIERIPIKSTTDAHVKAKPEITAAGQSYAGNEKARKPAEEKLNHKPAIALALVAIAAITGYVLLSDDSQHTSSEVAVSENDEPKQENKIRTHAEERATALKAMQEEQERKAAELSTSRAEEQAREAALKARQEEEARKKAMQEAERIRSDEERTKAALAARLERKRAAIQKAKREESVRKKKAAREVARKNALEEVERKKAEAEAQKIIQEQELANSAELEARRQEEAHKQKILEILQLEGNTRDAFE